MHLSYTFIIYIYFLHVIYYIINTLVLVHHSSNIVHIVKKNILCPSICVHTYLYMMKTRQASAVHFSLLFDVYTCFGSLHMCITSTHIYFLTCHTLRMTRHRLGLGLCT